MAYRTKFAWLLACAALAGCASIVKKPDIDKVAKVAVLSVYANETVPESSGRGVVTGWDNSFRMEVAENALAISETYVGKLGWHVVPANTIVSSRDYQDAFTVKANSGNEKLDAAASAVGNFMMRQRMTNFFTPPGMHPIVLKAENTNSKCYGNNCPEDPREKLAAIANKMGVDAVVIVGIDYCYGGGTWSLAGTGEAKMTAASWIRAVSKEGQTIIDMHDQERCKGDTRAESENSMFMHQGNLVFLSASKDKMKAMFAQATEGSIKKSIDTIQKAWKK
jgi:hypothetical protein